MSESLNKLRAAEEDARLTLWGTMHRDYDGESHGDGACWTALYAYRTAVLATQLAEIQATDRIMRAAAHHDPSPAGRAS